MGWENLPGEWKLRRAKKYEEGTRLRPGNERRRDPAAGFAASALAASGAALLGEGRPHGGADAVRLARARSLRLGAERAEPDRFQAEPPDMETLCTCDIPV